MYKRELKKPDVLAASDQVVYGAPITGGGFGGSMVALAALGEGPGAAARIANRYARTGGEPQILVAGGAACSPS